MWLAGKAVDSGRKEESKTVGSGRSRGNIGATPSETDDRPMAETGRERRDSPNPNDGMVRRVVSQVFQKRAPDGRCAERREDVSYEKEYRQGNFMPSVVR